MFISCPEAGSDSELFNVLADGEKLSFEAVHFSFRIFSLYKAHTRSILHRHVVYECLYVILICNKLFLREDF